MNWLPPQPPLALLEGLGPLLLVVFWVIKQVLSAKQEAKDEGEADPDADESVEQPPVARQARAGGAGGNDEVRSEVEEFLRRVERMRGGDPDAGDPPPEAPQRGPIDPFDEPRRPRPVAARQQRVEPQIELLVDPEQAAEPNPVRRGLESGGALTAAAATRTSVDDITSHAGRLGSEIAQSDERLEERLHQRFDHRLGKIAGDAETADPAATSEPAGQAARVRAILASPAGVRDAIVVNEVLKRRSDTL